ncbi:MAG TPA: hypothetical protein VGI73_05120 [Solirubrobacterales bacterium]
MGALALVGLAAAPASANLEFSSLGIQLREADGTYSRQAGAHSDFNFSFAFPEVETRQEGVQNIGPPEAMKDVELELPRGMYANPQPFATCTPQQFTREGFWTACPVASQIGSVDLTLTGGFGGKHKVALFNLSHGPDVPARFGFRYIFAMVQITPRVRPGDYGITSATTNASQAEGIQAVSLHLWGVPGDPRHDEERQHVNRPEIFPEQALGTEAPRTAFFTNPSGCPDEAGSFTAHGDSWEHPGVFDTRQLPTDEEGNPFVWEGCENQPFDPSLVAKPGTYRAHSPTGLDVVLAVAPDDGAGGYSAANVKRTVVDFPQGMTVSPSAVAGLGACSEAQVGLGSNDAPTCPDGSKIGNVTIKTQLLGDPLEGDVVLATQNANPFHSTFAIYLLAKGPGFWLKLPGELNLDPQTGRLKVIFDNLPELPFETAHLDFRGGPTAPLVTPSVCGNYAIRTEVFSWAKPTEPTVVSQPMDINEDCAGGGGFNPELQAGVANPVAGARSPLTIKVHRLDGEQNISRLEFTLPEGELASLKGVAVCPDSLAGGGNCPVGSQVGIATTTIGTGAFPLVVPQPGKAPTALYLAGPYKGAPYSLVTTVPAQAGPFDFGDIVVRTAINLNPVTTQVIAKSDPLPQILEGVPISYRDVRIEVQKPDFTVNPTSCEQRAVTSTITSIDGTQVHPSVPTKVGDCASLNFGPKLALRLKGGTHRGDFPQLTATLTTGKKEANIARVATTLPHSEFLEQGHIGTICTRVQFAAKQCPAASVYGHARAFTPLLDEPLEGPVYLRSSSHPLPDLVAELNGQFDVELSGRIDSHNQGIRTTFETVPDAPVTKFVLQLKGGKKSLLVNSRNLCKAPSRATIRMVGQNGMLHKEQPPMQDRCKAKKGGNEKGGGGKGARR